MRYEGCNQKGVARGDKAAQLWGSEQAVAGWARPGARRPGREMQALGGAGGAGLTLEGCVVGDGCDL